jgi:hypothetical protein
VWRGFWWLGRRRWCVEWIVCLLASLLVKTEKPLRADDDGFLQLKQASKVKGEDEMKSLRRAVLQQTTLGNII